MPLAVDSYVMGPFQSNCYVIRSERGATEAAIVDPGDDPTALRLELARMGTTVGGILVTHTDVDHIGGLPGLLAEFPDVPVAVHDAEREVVEAGKPLRQTNWGFELPPVAKLDRLQEGETYRAGSLEFEVLHTPGHSPGGVTLKIGNALFTGDALFAGSIGRSDFHNSDGQLLLDSIKGKLLAEADEMLVFPGHMAPSTIGRERKLNPFL